MRYELEAQLFIDGKVDLNLGRDTQGKEQAQKRGIFTNFGDYISSIQSD